MRSCPIALSIAGSDSSGGAGIQADLKTFSALGCCAMTAVTALTAQNTKGVKAVFPVPAAFIGRQISAVLGDIGADAVKIGMLGGADAAETVAAALRKHKAKNIVLDPVMFSKNGVRLLAAGAENVLLGELVPMSAVFTPNIPEAQVLLGEKITSASDMELAAIKLARYGARAVVVKGGHLGGSKSPDCAYLGRLKKTYWFDSPRIRAKNTHGTGCVFSAAIAAYLAKGCAIPEAVRRAKTHLAAALRQGRK